MSATHIWLVEEALEGPLDDDIEWGVIAVCNDVSTTRPLAEQSVSCEFRTMEWRDNDLWVKVGKSWYHQIRVRLIECDKFLPELQGAKP